jgi:mRNA (2'-O-methyladenosine-N6-)-methyltransferase
VDEIVWVKVTVNRRLAKSHGYYLQHAKEVCLVGQRGSLQPGWGKSVGSDVILSERRGQSQKPEEIYELIEQMVPGGEGLLPGTCQLMAAPACEDMLEAWETC